MFRFHKESFIKSFLLFFLVIEALLVFIFYNYFKIEKEHLEENIFLEMKNYSYFFDSKKFDIDIVKNQNQPLYELLQDDKFLYIFTKIEGNKENLLKVYYKKELFLKELEKIKQNLIYKFILLSFVNLFISVTFTIYSLYPLQKAYFVLKEFMKDIIHDLNTPLSTIKLNLSLLDENEETKSIKNSVKTLQMLYRNLENYLNSPKLLISQVSVKELLKEQIDFFQLLYEHLNWEVDIEDEVILTDKYMLGRVIYNILQNACKYNKQNGFVKVIYKNKQLIVQNSSFGIKNPSKIFKRFYKESNRGLGIGLHIVSKILKKLGYKYSLEVDKNNVVTFKLTLK